ncbi:unnamed protein product [Dimorphilus gyrociliatus]|uniref:Hcy-binding domain-containing protein n=1 Tax=Dimorphilus gyrociliatus TaxID=2664684 RepID=A0A7I8W695_9ANNE|nr:unnamed protein product [Dimorphilus gyrociliatus]
MITWPKNLILDGGLTTTLSSYGITDAESNPLFGAHLIETNPDAIYRLHLDFLEAGSNIIETATYQGSIKGFKQHLNVSDRRAEELLREGVNLAQRAKRDFWSGIDDKAAKFEPKIAGSLGPYGAHLLDGSEYTGDYVHKITDSQLKDWHRKQITQLVAANVDILGFDTFPSLKEALCVATLLNSEFKDVSAWISFSSKDEINIADGNSFKTCVQELLPFKNIVGFGVNCCSPRIVEPLMKSVIDIVPKDRYLLAYPNSGEEWLAKDCRWGSGEEKETPIHTFIKGWKSLGVNWIGGCCRVNPRDIRLIHREMSS